MGFEAILEKLIAYLMYNIKTIVYVDKITVGIYHDSVKIAKDLKRLFLMM